MAEELHALLRNAGVPGPYVLVGHSLGGMNVRVYAGLYPSEVAGMVLVDSSHEETYARLPRAALDAADGSKIDHQRARATALLGLERLFKSRDNHLWLPAEVRGMYMAAESKTQTYLTVDGSVARIIFQVLSLPQVLPTRLIRPVHEAQSLSL